MGAVASRYFDEIRAAPQLNSVPVVLVTAADASATVPKAVEKGFSGYISKPMTTLCFLSRLQPLLMVNLSGI